MLIDPISVDGLAAFSRNLKKLDSDLPKALRIALNEAAQVVVDYAAPRIPRRTGRAAASLKAKSTRTKVRVGAGGRRAPYFPWLDYGGRVGRKHATARPFIKEGRYVYKGYFAKRDSGEFQDVLTKALLGVAAQAGVVVE